MWTKTREGGLRNNEFCQHPDLSNIFSLHRLESSREACSRSVTLHGPLFTKPSFHYRIQNGMPLLHIQARLIQPIFSPPYVDSKGLLRYSQGTAIGSYYKPDSSSPFVPHLLFKFRFNIILPSTDVFSNLSSNMKHRNHVYLSI